MQYVLLIHAAESRFAARSADDAEAIHKAYGALTRALVATGRAGDCAGLEATHTATSVRVREGKRTVKDGPFAETREQLAGYYSIDAESEEEALAWAAKIPDATGGTVEVRPLMTMPTAPSAASPAVDPVAHKQYVLLLHEPESTRASRTDGDRDAMYGRYLALNAELKAAGKLVAGAPLDAAAKARSVHVDAGRRVVRDGPFAETREQLGGYYRVWARNLDEAIALAARIPAAETGTVEVRPVKDTSAYA